MNKTYSLENLSEIASEVIGSAKNKTLLFYGQMGVGKTTLIKEICKQLSVLDTNFSPTFSLVNEHKKATNEKVFHFYFYRINEEEEEEEEEEEALDMGIEDYLYNNDWCLIERPENIQNLVPINVIKTIL